jgi:hypothetical protein
LVERSDGSALSPELPTIVIFSTTAVVEPLNDPIEPLAPLTVATQGSSMLVLGSSPK